MASSSASVVTYHDLPADLHRAIQQTRRSFSEAPSRTGKTIPQDTTTAGNESAPSLVTLASPERQAARTAFGVHQSFLPHHAGAVDPRRGDHPDQCRRS